MIVEINKNLYEIIDSNYINNMYIKNNKYYINLKTEYTELFEILGIIKMNKGGVLNDGIKF